MNFGLRRPFRGTSRRHAVSTPDGPKRHDRRLAATASAPPAAPQPLKCNKRRVDSVLQCRNFTKSGHILANEITGAVVNEVIRRSDGGNKGQLTLSEKSRTRVAAGNLKLF